MHCHSHETTHITIILTQFPNLSEIQNFHMLLRNILKTHIFFGLDLNQYLNQITLHAIQDVPLPPLGYSHNTTSNEDMYTLKA